MARSIKTVFFMLIYLCLFFANSILATTENTELFLSLNRPSVKKAKIKFESEHRPVRKRQYWIGGRELSSAAEAFVRHPDGSIQDLKIETTDHSSFVRLKMPWGDGPSHGIHNTYVVDRQVIDETLVVRTAKWSTIHHSCAWGHEYKYDPVRLVPAAVDKAPLEISGVGLWDGNFHVRTRTGQNLQFQVFRAGVLQPEAKIAVTSEKKWVRQLVSDAKGSIVFQMIRDYYPESWDRFKRTRNGSLFLKAEYEFDEQGSLDGASYSKVRLISTLPWRYAPAKQDYTSYQAGLAIGGVSFLVTMVGIFLFRMKRRRPFQELVFDEKA